jgi:3-oxoacyl-[acyl-carrier protein] reductase
MTATISELPQLEVGATARFSKTITAEDVQGFAALSGDFNPLHLDADFARKTTFGRPVVHGMLLGSFVSRMIGMQLPGAGALWMRQSFQWAAPVFVGDTVEITLKVAHKSVGSNTITLEVSAVNQNGKTVMTGDGAVRLLEQEQAYKPGRSLKERVVLISGGTAHAGAAMALRLAREGAAVAVNSSLIYGGDEASAMDLAATILQDGGRAMAVRLDSSDLNSAKAGLDLIRQEFGRPVDVLINNATASFAPRPFMDLSWEIIQDVLDAEIRRVFHCCQAVLPGMMEQKSGCIVNIGSVMTRQVPAPQWAPFVVAKSALQGLTRSLASEFGPQGIRVNMVSLNTGDLDASAGNDRLRKVQAMQTPLRRLAAPEDIAQAVVFLCSEAGSFITGVDLPVAGGFSL